MDCIFPRTKKAPSGNTPYFCHVCKPRPTELTREEVITFYFIFNKFLYCFHKQELLLKIDEMVICFAGSCIPGQSEEREGGGQESRIEEEIS